MILGMSIESFTLLHVVISLIGIAAGFVVIFGMMSAKRLPALTVLFLVTTVLTNLTGFLFPFKGITPGIVIGILSIFVLGLAIFALYGGHLAGKWRGTYVIASIVALYFNFFILIVQSFQKIPALQSLAPTQSELPFKVAQLVTLVLFVILGTLAFKKFRFAD
jgi:hypothetical protein